MRTNEVSSGIFDNSISLSLILTRFLRGVIPFSESLSSSSASITSADTTSIFSDDIVLNKDIQIFFKKGNGIRLKAVNESKR